MTERIQKAEEDFMSEITKKAIAEGLKELTKTKKFEKISITDITSFCGLNRQTFYYHFEDKYELVNWIYYQEIFLDLVKGISFQNWDEHLLLLLKAMKRENWFYINTIKSQGEYFKEYLFSITKELFLDAIEELDNEKKLSEEDKTFFAEFYTYGICGMVLSWVENGMKEAPENITYHMKQLVMNSEKIAYKRYSQEREKRKE